MVNVQTKEINQIFKDKVIIRFPKEMEVQEALAYFDGVPKHRNSNRLDSLDIELNDFEEIILAPHYDSIVRVRRITGYLSTKPRFNDAKKAEVEQRLPHIKFDS